MSKQSAWFRTPQTCSFCTLPSPLITAVLTGARRRRRRRRRKWGRGGGEGGGGRRGRRRRRRREKKGTEKGSILNSPPCAPCFQPSSKSYEHFLRNSSRTQWLLTSCSPTIWSPLSLFWPLQEPPRWSSCSLLSVLHVVNQAILPNTSNQVTTLLRTTQGSPISDGLT